MNSLVVALVTSVVLAVIVGITVAFPGKGQRPAKSEH